MVCKFCTVVLAALVCLSKAMDHDMDSHPMNAFEHKNHNFDFHAMNEEFNASHSLSSSSCNGFASISDEYNKYFYIETQKYAYTKNEIEMKVQNW